jgi:uncharacterized protein YneF (UPF0154 family)
MSVVVALAIGALRGFWENRKIFAKSLQIGKTA